MQSIWLSVRLKGTASREEHLQTEDKSLRPELMTSDPECSWSSEADLLSSYFQIHQTDELLMVKDKEPGGTAKSG